MNFTHLYIIGNGFDLHYGVKSSYGDFLRYLEKRDENLYDLFFQLFPAEIWENFEGALGLLKPGSLNQDVFGLIERDDESDFSWERESASYNYHLSAMEEELDMEKINAVFSEWASQIDISGVVPDSVIRDSTDTLYMTFNYTLTLETVFGVDPDRILHIHGKIGDPRLVIGHAPVKESRLPPQQYYEQDELEELRLRFTSWTEKPVQAIIGEHEHWFEALSSVEDVTVSGFSFSNVDLPYIQRVIECISPDAKWFVCKRPSDPPADVPMVGKVRTIPYP